MFLGANEVHSLYVEYEITMCGNITCKSRLCSVCVCVFLFFSKIALNQVASQWGKTKKIIGTVLRSPGRRPYSETFFCMALLCLSY